MDVAEGADEKRAAFLSATWWADGVIQNSLFIMGTSVVNAATGFVFWIIAARSYAPDEVGLAVPLLTGSALIAAVAGLGLDSVLLRFLSQSADRHRLINATMTISVAAAFALTFVLEGIASFTGVLAQIVPSTLGQTAAYALFVAGLSASVLLTGTFVALRRAKYGFVLTAIAALLKLPLLPLFAVFWPSFGLVASWGVAMVVAVLVGLVFLLPRAERGYRAMPALGTEELRHAFQFSGANYLVTLSTTAVPFVTPLLLLAYLPAKENAFYYIAFTLASPLTVVAQSLATSSYAEASAHPEKATHVFRRGIRNVYALLVPAVVIALLVGPFVLRIFGSSYADSGAWVFRLLAASTLLNAAILFYLADLRLRQRNLELATLSVLGMALLLATTWILLARSGLGSTAVGVGYVVAYAVLAGWALWRAVVAPRQRPL